MGRRPRIHFPGAIYHVMARGVDGRDIFIDDHDRSTFLQALNRVAEECGAEVLAYCLMGNHFHLAIKVGGIGLSALMQRLLTGYSTRFNLRQNRTGHLFQARYKAIVCLDDAYLATIIRYIHFNPVKAGLVARARDWPWSSVDRNSRDEDDDFADFDPWSGDSKLAAKLCREAVAQPCSLGEIGANVCAQAGVSIEKARSKSSERTLVGVRRLLAQTAFRNGYSMTTIARWLGTSVKSVSRYSGNKVSGLTPT